MYWQFMSFKGLKADSGAAPEPDCAKGLQDSVELCGAFCMGNCTKGVCVKIDEELFSLKPENTREFFETR